MLWLSVRHFCAGATLDDGGSLKQPCAPILRGWIGKHWGVVVGYYQERNQYVESRIL